MERHKKPAITPFRDDFCSFAADSSFSFEFFTWEEMALDAPVLLVRPWAVGKVLHVLICCAPGYEHPHCAHQSEIETSF